MYNYFQVAGVLWLPILFFEKFGGDLKVANGVDYAVLSVISRGMLRLYYVTS